MKLLILSMFLLAGCSAAGGADPPAGEIPGYTVPSGSPSNLAARTAELEDHILIAENQNYEMYLKEDTLGLIIRDKTNGAWMRSTVAEPNETDNNTWKGLYQSGVTLQYISGTNLNMTQADFINNVHTKKMYYRNDGFSADVSFYEAGISYTLTVTLTENGFTAEIPQSSIREERPNNAVGAIYVYPFLGHSVLGSDKGYMFIPDGQGALIELRDNERRFPAPFLGDVYGENTGLNVTSTYFRELVPPEKVLMPVYGMVHTEKGIGFLGIIESGAENARIEAWPNGASTQYDWIAARFLYRHVFMQPTGQTGGTVQSRTERPNRIDIKIRFEFTAGDDVGYDDLALSYRDYLRETGAFASAAADVYRTQVDFFGLEKRDWALFKLNVNMTRFSDAADILKDLSDAGVKAPLSVYSGWRSGGYTAGVPNTGYSPASSLGGSGGFSRLARTAEEEGVLLFLQTE